MADAMIDDPRVVDILTKAGWSEHRTVSTRAAEAALTRAGFAVWDALSAFLRGFSGLTVRFMRNGREDAAWFDAERATAWADAASVRAYEKIVGTTLAPVGCAYHDHLLVLASRDGRFFAAYDDLLAHLGDSPTALLRTLLNGKVRALETGERPGTEE